MTVVVIFRNFFGISLWALIVLFFTGYFVFFFKYFSCVFFWGNLLVYLWMCLISKDGWLVVGFLAWREESL